MNGNSQCTLSTHPRRRKRYRAHLSPQHEIALKRKLRRTTPSEPWIEAQFKTNEEIDQDGETTVHRYHDPHVFPPGGRLNTAMIRCPKCGVFMPPNAFEAGACLDHAEHRGWGPSPSAIAIQRLQMLHLRLSIPELPPEDIAALVREIDEYKRKRNDSKTRLKNRKVRRTSDLSEKLETAKA